RASGGRCVSACLPAPAGLDRVSQSASLAVSLVLKLLQAWISAPVLLFLLTLTAMLFRPPDLKSFPFDRIAFTVLVGALGVRFCMGRERLQSYSATWPMLALALLGLWSVLTQPYDPQAWSVFAAKCLVPFTLFHVAGLAFRDQSALRKLEVFSLVTLTYLSLTSVFFLFD